MWAFQFCSRLLFLFGLDESFYLAISRVAEAADQHQMFRPAKGSMSFTKTDDLARELWTYVWNSFELLGRGGVYINGIRRDYILIRRSRGSCRPGSAGSQSDGEN